MKKLVVLGLLGVVFVSAFTGCVRAIGTPVHGNSAQAMSGTMAATEEATTEEIVTQEPTTEAPTKEAQTDSLTKAPTEEPTTERPTENVVEIVNKMLKKADEYYVNNEDGYFEVFEELKTEYPEYAYLAIERETYYSEYESYSNSIWLLGEEPFDSKYMDGPKVTVIDYDYFVDKFGTEYDMYLEAIMSETNVGKNNRYVVYNANGEYDTFEGMIVPQEETDEINLFHAEVYGDGELIYTTETINGYSDPLTFTVDIAGYRLVKICLVREDDYLSIAKAQPSVALVEAWFYNQNIPEFIPFEPIEE